MTKRRRILSVFCGGIIAGSLFKSFISSPNEGVPSSNISSDYKREIHQNTIEITYTFVEELGVRNTREIKSKIEIPKNLYNKHADGSDIYHREILESSTDSFVENEISNAFIPDYKNKEVWNIMRFVQDIKYRRDWKTTNSTDYTRHPVETIVDMVGDCKDKTNLLYSILKNRGYNVGYIIYPQHIAPIISKKQTSVSTDNIEIIHENEKHKYIVLESTSFQNMGVTEYEKSNAIYTYTDYGGFTIKNMNAIDDQIKKMFKDRNKII